MYEDHEPPEPSDDFDIYAGANWQGDEDMIDQYEAAAEQAYHEWVDETLTGLGDIDAGFHNPENDAPK